METCGGCVVQRLRAIGRGIVLVAPRASGCAVQCGALCPLRGSPGSGYNYNKVVRVRRTDSQTVKPQLVSWAQHFIPDWQFGFIPDCGTTDYGVALTLTIQDCLERRKQGVSIATDIRGAFDRC